MLTMEASRPRPPRPEPSEDTLQQLVRSHVPHLLGRARRLLADEAGALGATREALSATLAGMGGASGPAELAEALETNLLEVALRWLRRNPGAVAMGDLLPAFGADGGFARAPRAFGPLPAAPLAHGLMQARVRACVHDLPADYRAAFLLCDVEGLSPRTAARYLGTSAAEVERRVHLARMALGELLRRSGFRTAEP